MRASENGHPDIVAYLLGLPAAKATINNINDYHPSDTALSYASCNGHASTVQFLLDAGADPTIPPGQQSPLNQATTHGHTAVTALLRHALAEPDRARFLHKARALLDAALVIPSAAQDAADEGEPPAAQRQKAIAAAPASLKGRVQRDEALPRVELTPPAPQQQQQRDNEERVRATAAYVLGLEEGGVEYGGLPGEVFVELLGYMLPAWADKGPDA